MPEIAERFLHTRIARSVEAIKRSFVDNLFYITGRTLKSANTIDHYTALAYTIRDRMLARWSRRASYYKRRGAKSVAYLSAEFLTGPHLANNLLNLELRRPRRARPSRRWASTSTRSLEPRRSPGSATAASAGSRPASWTRSRRSRFPPSATASATSSASSIRTIRDGWQVELTDDWLRYGNPWEIARPEMRLPRAVRRPHRALRATSTGRYRVRWMPERDRHRRRLRHADPRLRRRHVNMLRLWRREAPRIVRLSQAFNVGDYYGAVERQGARRENITKVLYPNDEPGRQAAAARAAVLLRLVRAAGHDPPHAARPGSAASASTRSSRSSSTTRIRRSRSPS